MAGQWRLRVTAPDSSVSERFLAAGEALVLGRGSRCEWRVFDRDLSRQHCAVRATPEGVEVEDLNSLNGLSRSWQRVSHVVLRAGEELSLGPNSRLRVLSLVEPEAVEPERFEALRLWFFIKGRGVLDLLMLPGQSLSVGSSCEEDLSFALKSFGAREFRWAYDERGLAVSALSLSGAATALRVNSGTTASKCLQLGDVVSLGDIDCYILRSIGAGHSRTLNAVCPRCRGLMSVGVSILREALSLETLKEECCHCRELGQLGPGERVLGFEDYSRRRLRVRMIRREYGLTWFCQSAQRVESPGLVAEARRRLEVLRSLRAACKARVLRVELGSGVLTYEEEWSDSWCLWPYPGWVRPLSVGMTVALALQLLNFLKDCQAESVFARLYVSNVYIRTEPDLRVFVQGYGLDDWHAALCCEADIDYGPWSLGLRAPEMGHWGGSDERTQIYDLGVIMSYSLTGSLPSECGALGLEDSVPGALRVVLERFLAEDPGRRPDAASAYKMLKSLSD